MKKERLASWEYHEYEAINLDFLPFNKRWHKKIFTTRRKGLPIENLLAYLSQNKNAFSSNAQYRAIRKNILANPDNYLIPYDPFRA